MSTGTAQEHRRNSSSFDEFESALQGLLAHLYDPLYPPTRILWALMAIDPGQGVVSLQESLIGEIEDLKPRASVPKDAPIRRYWELLFYRYVQGLTQETVAERLGITTRHLRTQQSKAIRVLAERLWSRSSALSSSGDVGTDVSGVAVKQQSRPNREIYDWLSQVKEEVSSLTGRSPEEVSDAGAAIQHVIELAHGFHLERCVELQQGFMQPDLLTTVHPSVLRQALLTLIGALAQHISSGAITLYGERSDSEVRITITACPIAGPARFDLTLAREILASQGGVLDIELDGNAASITIVLQAASPVDAVAVLVVDDNLDLVSFFRTYTVGTPYEITHIAEAHQVFAAIEEAEPDVIVLDVMLPDPAIDGWELLAQLHEHPETRSIPVIICSVIRERQLALSLGAASYLPKPVRRKDFIEALDGVVRRAPA